MKNYGTQDNSLLQATDLVEVQNQAVDVNITQDDKESLRFTIYQITKPLKNQLLVSLIIVVGLLIFLIGTFVGINYQKRNWRQISDCRFYKRTIFNEQNVGKIFGKDQRFYINISKIIPNTINVWKSLNPLDTKGPNDTIYTLTPNDLNKLVDVLDFQKIRDDVSNYFAYEVLQFKYDQTVNMIPEKITFQNLKNDNEYLQYLQGFKKTELYKTNKDLNFHIAVQLIQNPKNKTSLQAEYLMFEKKYNLSSIQKQIPICIYGGGYNLYKRNQYIPFFESIERLNYTNYHVVYVDDYSPDKFSYKVYQYIQDNKLKIRNRIKIIRNLQSVGNLGNIYFLASRFCNDEDVIVILDADDAYIGAQPLKVINKFYADPNIWYAWTRFIGYNPGLKTYAIGQSSSWLYVKTGEYRRTGFFMTSLQRTFRCKLIKKVPIYHFAQYHYNSTTGIGWPTFPLSAGDSYSVYSMLELAGDDRYKFIQQYVYNYYSGAENSRNCYALHQWFDGTKSVLKTPLKRLNSFEQKAVQVQNYSYPEDKYRTSISINQNGISYKCYTI